MTEMEGGLGTDLTVLVVSLAIIPAVLAALLICIKIRASRSNQDVLYGVEGTVKKKGDETLNTSGNSDKHHLSVEDANIRTPSYDRKLPEIPDDIYKTSMKDDNSSDLYATVDENLAQNLIPQGASAVSDDPSLHPYAKVQKPRKQEHPYAKVRENKAGNRELEDEDDETEYETTGKQDQTANGPTHVGGATSASPSGAGYPSGPSSVAGVGFLSSAAPPGVQNFSPGQAGGNFSPWMPPPARNPSRQATPLPPEPASQQQQQQHFSGDSQDSTYSTKGYTSISVREPLDNLRSAVPPSQPTIQEGNYVTLSETSDEMYAAIEDNVYMDPEGPSSQGARPKTGANEDPSLMYSKIDKKKKRNERQTASYDGGYATVNKNRQSSGENYGARPKQRYSATPFLNSENSDVDYSGYEIARVDSWNHRPGETRKSDPGYETVPYAQQSNDDFSNRAPPAHPPFPPGGGTSPFNRDPHHQSPLPRDVSGASNSSANTSLTSMTGGLTNSNNMSGGSNLLLPASSPATVSSHNNSRNSGGRNGSAASGSGVDPGYEVLPGEQLAMNISGSSNSSNKRAASGTGSGRELRDPDYETVPAQAELREPGYETLPHRFRSDSFDPGYETLSKRIDPASVGPNSNNRPEGSAGAVGGPRSYPDYSHRYHHREYREPGYETVSELRLKDPDYESVINSEGNQGQSSEPGYETLPDRSSRLPSINNTPTAALRGGGNGDLARPYATPSPDRHGNTGLTRSGGVSGRLSTYSGTPSPDRLGNSATRPKPAGPRAAPPFKSPRPSPKVANNRLNHIYRSSEPELNRNGPESSIRYQSFRNEPPTHKFSVDSEEGYETIPAVSAAATIDGGVDSNDDGDSATPKYTRLLERRRSSDDSDIRNTRLQSAAAMEAEYELVQQDYENSSNGGNDLSKNPDSSVNVTSMGSKMNNEDINYIDEDVDSGPGTPGSPTIHMSVVDTGPGVRRASVVMIERLGEEAEDQQNSYTHIFV